MSAHWSREDLPNWETIRDLDEASGNGLRTRMVVIDIALDAVVEHLNAHFPKVATDTDYVATVWERMYHVASKGRSAAADSAQMWMDEATSQRQRADEATAAAEAFRDLRAETIGQLRAEVRRLENEVDTARDDERLHAWGRITRHPFFANRYMPQGTLVESMLAALDDAVEAMIVPVDIVDETDGFCVCNGPESGGLMGDCGIAAHRAEWRNNRVDAKARELFDIAWPTANHMTAQAMDSYRRVARHVLGYE